MRSLSVITLAQTLVTPSEPTPTTTTLRLSSLDSHPSLSFCIRALQVYPHAGASPAPASTIRGALAKALVHYYPLAGRLVVDAESKLVIQVDCNGQGAWLTEARALCTLEDARHLDHPYSMPPKELVPLHRDKDGDDAPLHLQVTHFACGALVVGVNVSHAMVDGTGLGQFLNAVAELARGYEQPSIDPVWHRESYPRIFSDKSPSISPAGDAHLHYYAIDIPVNYIDRVKRDYTEKMGVKCTAFEVSAGLIWQCRTRAIKLDPHIDVTLSFSVDTRRLLSDVLPPKGGYYGNCFRLARVAAPSQFISNASILEVVKLISQAKAELAFKFDEDPLKLEINYETLVVTDCVRLGLNETDYGWGTPSRVIFPADMPYVQSACFLGLPSANENSRRATTVCVREEHLEAFRREIRKLAPSSFSRL